MIKVSVIIPFFNSTKYLPQCLQALADQKHDNVEFIMVDNGSTDDSLSVAKKFAAEHAQLDIKVIEERKRGASAARNKGADIAEGAWLVFTDSDCIPDPNWLLDLSAPKHARSDIGALAGCIKPWKTENLIAKFLGWYTLPANIEERIYWQFTLVEGGFPTANLAVRKDIFKKIGGFDETIPIYGEDHDLCARIYKAGYGIKTLTNAIVYHRHRNDLEGMVRQSFRFGESHALNLRKHFKKSYILDAPGLNIRKVERRLGIWIDLNQADKKMLIAMALAILWWPLWSFPLAYILYLNFKINQQRHLHCVTITYQEVPVFALLLLIKSALMTCGRLIGSMRYRVICI
jgi:GT2 family glycosyltransferase